MQAIITDCNRPHTACGIETREAFTPPFVRCHCNRPHTACGIETLLTNQGNYIAIDLIPLAVLKQHDRNAILGYGYVLNRSHIACSVETSAANSQPDWETQGGAAGRSPLCFRSV